MNPHLQLKVALMDPSCFPGRKEMREEEKNEKRAGGKTGLSSQQTRQQ